LPFSGEMVPGKQGDRGTAQDPLSERFNYCPAQLSAIIQPIFWIFFCKLPDHLQPMKGKHMTCTLAVLALFFGIISPAWLTEGMFLDGVTYAAISKNLAGGLGSFWDLHYTSTLYPHFHEHPPLAFGLQALFFRVLGDGFLTERIYSVGTYLISGIIMIRIWKRVAGEEIASLSWLPLLFWITIPLVTWSAPNNLLENTLMVFTGLSVLFILRSLTSNRVLNLSLAGFMLFLGFLTKGFVALFPLSLPFWTWLLGPGGSWKRFLKETGILLASMALLFLLLFLLVPESRTSLPAYFHKQVAGSIRNVVTVESRFYILRRMFTELIPALVLVMVILVFTRKYQGLHVRNHWILSFLAVGLSGVLPIMISMKQRGFYILPAFPFFSMAISLYAAPRVKYLMDQVRFLTIRSVALRYAAASLLVAALLLNGVQFKKAGRDSEMIGDISILQEQIPAGSTIAVTSGLWEEWALHAYFQRRAGISLDDQKPVSRPFLLVGKGSDPEIPEGFKREPLELSRYELYRMRPAP
jgi:4-amino-4-deoxy-L-arabinose transferase-like glycosyltransferase